MTLRHINFITPIFMIYKCGLRGALIGLLAGSIVPLYGNINGFILGTLIGLIIGLILGLSYILLLQYLGLHTVLNHRSRVIFYGFIATFLIIFLISIISFRFGSSNLSELSINLLIAAIAAVASLASTRGWIKWLIKNGAGKRKEKPKHDQSLVQQVSS